MVNKFLVRVLIIDNGENVFLKYVNGEIRYLNVKDKFWVFVYIILKN